MKKPEYPFAPQVIDCHRPTCMQRLKRAVAALIKRITNWRT
jgi:hypothetical protein